MNTRKIHLFYAVGKDYEQSRFNESLIIRRSNNNHSDTFRAEVSPFLLPGFHSSRVRVPLWVLETCLIVGLLPFDDHLDHSFVVFKHIQQSFLVRRIDV